MSLSLEALSVLYSQHIPIEFYAHNAIAQGDISNSVHRFLVHPRHIKTIEKLFVEQQGIWMPKLHDTENKDQKYRAFTTELLYGEKKDSVHHDINGEAAVRTTEMGHAIYKYYQLGLQHDTPEHTGYEEYKIIPAYNTEDNVEQERLRTQYHYNMGEMISIIEYDVETGKVKRTYKPERKPL